MDFIPFNSSSSNRNKTSSPQNFQTSSQKSTPPSNTKKMSFSSPGMPAFGSPAVNFNFGAPAVQNSGFDTQNRTPSPGQYNKQFSPRTRGNNMSPRGYYNSNLNYRNQHHSPYSQKDCYNQYGDNSRMSNDASNFKTPHQFSSNRGRGNGRKSFNKQFGQTPRNYNQGGNLYIEDYYHPSMIEDPWCSLSPVLIRT